MSERTYNIILVILIVVACIVTGALLYLIYDSTVPPGRDRRHLLQSHRHQFFQRMHGLEFRAAGKMTAGTSADYPPFAYWTSDYKLDGLDIALISEIGQTLGG